MSPTLDVNLSILAIPAYIVLATIPHFYAISIVKRSGKLEWPNQNPRGMDFKLSLKSALLPASFEKFERAEAAHANTLENVPMFAVAIILGNLANLNVDGSVDRYALQFLVLRALHTVFYIRVSELGWSRVRSVIYLSSLALCFNMYWRVAKALR